VITVAAATVAPAQPTRPTGIVIAAPDTGTGDGAASDGIAGGALMTLFGAAIAATAGFAMIRKATR
jgi:hypothetical protein